MRLIIFQKKESPFPMTNWTERCRAMLNKAKKQKKLNKPYRHISSCQKYFHLHVLGIRKIRPSLSYLEPISKLSGGNADEVWMLPAQKPTSQFITNCEVLRLRTYRPQHLFSNRNNRSVLFHSPRVFGSSTRNDWLSEIRNRLSRISRRC